MEAQRVKREEDRIKRLEDAEVSAYEIRLRPPLATTIEVNKVKLSYSNNKAFWWMSSTQYLLCDYWSIPCFDNGYKNFLSLPIDRPSFQAE
jgi:hypothetical protein